MVVEKCDGSIHIRDRTCHRYSSASLIILRSCTVALATRRSRKGLVLTLLTSLTLWAIYGPLASLTVPRIVRTMVSAPMDSASATQASMGWIVPTSPVPEPSVTMTRTASSTALTAATTDMSTLTPMNIFLESESSLAKSEMMAMIRYHLQATRRAFAMVLERANALRHSWETIVPSKIASTTAASTATATLSIPCRVASVDMDTLASTAKTLPV